MRLRLNAPPLWDTDTRAKRHTRTRGAPLLTARRVSLCITVRFIGLSRTNSYVNLESPAAGFAAANCCAACASPRSSLSLSLFVVLQNESAH